MSKVSMPRPRYVSFVAQGPPLGRGAMQRVLQEAAAGWQGPPPQLMRYRFPDGIVRCEHDQLPALRLLLAAIQSVHDRGEAGPLTLTSTSTSGTLKALTGRTGVLRDRGGDPKAPSPDARRPAGPAAARSAEGPARGIARPRT